MDTIEIKKIVDELLNYLPEKSRNILISRFGLAGDKPQTLEAIGNVFGVTRERVRQIESASFKALRKVKKLKKTTVLFNNLKEKLLEQGGFLDEKGFRQLVFGKTKLTLIQRNQLSFILNSHSKFYYQKGTVKFGGIWYLKDSKKNVDKIRKIHEQIIAYFNSDGKLMQFNELLRVIRKADFCNSEGCDFLKGVQGKNRLEMLLRNSRVIGKNIINQWGLKSWKMISQKGSREKAYLIYSKYKKPLHFRELTEYINKHWGNKKKAVPQTVHNAIIMYDEFVAIESGVYALREWDIFDEYIQEEIIKLLEKEQKFIQMEKIIEYITTKKDVQSFVIQAILYNKELFIRRNDKYMLK